MGLARIATGYVAGAGQGRLMDSSIALDRDGLAAFFDACRERKHAEFPHANLASFLDRLRNSGLGRLPHAAGKRDVLVRPNQDSLAQFFSASAHMFETLNNRFRENPWQMAGIGRYEVRNSAVLGQLFDSAVSPVAGPRFLANYFDCVTTANDRCSALPTLTNLASGYRIGIEHCPTGSQSERVDITVEGRDFVIGIEIKIDAGEGPEQLERYKQVIRRRAEARQCSLHGVIYLSPRPTATLDVLQSSWRHISRAADKTSREVSTNNWQAAWLLACFAAHVRKFY